jgi:uncharacterized protein YcgI (DUF1989 family)
MPSLNLFRSVRVADDGSISLDAATGGPGAHVTLRAEMDVLLVLVHAPHVLDPGPDLPVGTVRVTAWRGAPAPADDPIRLGSPEATRAFENTEEHLRR